MPLDPVQYLVVDPAEEVVTVRQAFFVQRSPQ